MIDFLEAQRKALKLNKRVNSCEEYEKAYRFLDKDDDAEGDTSVVVLKETGEALNFINFIFDYHPEKKPKEIPMRV